MSKKCDGYSIDHTKLPGAAGVGCVSEVKRKEASWHARSMMTPVTTLLPYALYRRFIKPGLSFFSVTISGSSTFSLSLGTHIYVCWVQQRYCLSN